MELDASVDSKLPLPSPVIFSLLCKKTALGLVNYLGTVDQHKSAPIFFS